MHHSTRGEREKYETIPARRAHAALSAASDSRAIKVDSSVSLLHLFRKHGAGRISSPTGMVPPSRGSAFRRSTSSPPPAPAPPPAAPAARPACTQLRLVITAVCVWCSCSSPPQPVTAAPPAAAPRQAPAVGPPPAPWRAAAAAERSLHSTSSTAPRALPRPRSPMLRPRLGTQLACAISILMQLQ